MSKINSSSTVKEIDEFIGDGDGDAYYFTPETTYSWDPDNPQPARWRRIESWSDLQDALYDKPTLIGDGSGETFFTATLVEDFGGEGQGDEYWIVVRLIFPDGVDRLVRKDGWYASYDGGYLDGDLREVQPVERMVTFYE